MISLQKKHTIAIIIFLILAQILFAFSRFNSIGGNKESVAKKISEKISAEIEIKGRVKISFFPFPHVQVTHFRANNIAIGPHTVNVRSPELRAYVDLFDLMTGKIDVKKTIFKNSRLDLVLFNNQQYETTTEAPNDNDVLDLQNIEFVNSGLSILNKNNELVVGYSDLNAQLYSYDDLSVRASFKSAIDQFKLNFKLSQDTEGQQHLNLNASFSDSRLIVAHQYKGKNGMGSVEISGVDLQKFIFNNISSQWFLFPDNKGLEFFTNISYEVSDDQILIRQAEIDSQNVEGSFSGSINNVDKTGSLNFNLNKLDINSLLTTHKKAFIAEEMAYLDLGTDNASFFSLFDYDIVTTGKIDSFITQDTKIGPINLDLTIEDGERPRVKDLSFKLTDNDHHKISGFYQKQETDAGKIKHSFLGNIRSKGSNLKETIKKAFPEITFADYQENNDFEFAANFELKDNVFNINNIIGKISEADVAGDIIWNSISSDKSALNLFFNRFNFDKYFLLNDKDQTRHIVHYIYENIAIRENNASLLQNFLWLRNIFNSSEFNIEFYNSVFNRNELGKITIQGVLDHRVMHLDKFNIQGKGNDFNLSFSANLDEKQPNFFLVFEGEAADLTFLNYHQDSYKFKPWSRDLFVFPNFNNVIFKARSDIKNLRYSEIFLKSLNAEISADQNYINIDNFSGEIDDGKYNVTGSFIMDGLPTLSIAYQFENFNIGNFSNFLFGIDNFSANTNLSGSLTTYGNTPFIMVKHIDSKNKFNMTNLRFKNFDIAATLQEFANFSKDPHNTFGNGVEEVLLSRGSTAFPSLSGEINIQRGIAVLDNTKLKLDNLLTSSVGKIDFENAQLKINSVIAFPVRYKVKNSIKASPVKLTNSLHGQFHNLQSDYNLEQLKNLVKNLKTLYIGTYEQIKDLREANE